MGKKREVRITIPVSDDKDPHYARALLKLRHFLDENIPLATMSTPLYLPTSYDIYLDNVSPGKVLQTIKEVRALPLGLGLMQAKDLVDDCRRNGNRKLLVENVTWDSAKTIQRNFKEILALVSIVPGFSEEDVHSARDKLVATYSDLCELVDRKTPDSELF